MTDKLATNATTAFAKTDGSADASPFKYYIDGSGSMFSPQSVTTKITAMGNAVGAVLDVSKKKGLPVDAVFYGDPALVPFMLKDKAEVAGLEQTLFCGVELAPIAQDIAQLAASGKKKHFAVLSDGDVGDYTVAKDAFATALQDNKGATIDFIIIHNTGYKTQVHQMAEKFAEAFPAQVTITTADASKEGCAHGALEDIIAKRQPAAGTASAAKAAPRP